MTYLVAAAKWISAHTNKVTEFGRQVMYALILFHVINWTPEQQIGALAAISAFFAMFTEGGTVSKSRVGERIEEKVAAQLADSGVFPTPEKRDS